MQDSHRRHDHCTVGLGTHKQTRRRAAPVKQAKICGVAASVATQSGRPTGRAIHSSICALVELLSARSRHCKTTSFITPANAPTRCTSLAPVDACCSPPSRILHHHHQRQQQQRRRRRQQRAGSRLSTDASLPNADDMSPPYKLQR